MAHQHHETLNRTRTFFDERAATWDTIISAEHPARLRRIIEPLPIPPEARVLDVGCGTGVLFPILADRLDRRGVVVAADLSFGMMRETAKRIAALPAPTAHLLLQADVTHPPLAEACFDWVICNSCFPHFHDQQAALVTLAALLKPGGRLVVCHTECRAAINERHRVVGGVVGGHELPDTAAMSAMIANAGLVLDILEDRAEAYLLVARK